MGIITGLIFKTDIIAAFHLFQDDKMGSKRSLMVFLKMTYFTKTVLVTMW